MLEEERQADCRQLWLCRHQPLWDPCQGTHSNTPQPLGLQRENKTQTCCQTGGKKQKPKTQRQRNPRVVRCCLLPTEPHSSPSRGVPASLEQGVSSRTADGHGPPAQTRLLAGAAELPPRSLPCWAAQAELVHGLWAVDTNGSERAAGAAGCPAEAARLPFSSLRNATTSLRGRWGSAKQLGGRPAPACLRARPLRHRHTWTGHRPRDAPGSPRCWVGCGQLSHRGGMQPGEQREGSPSSHSSSRRVARPLVPHVFRGMDAAGGSCRRCWPTAGDSRGWSPPGVRNASASPPTSRQVRSSAGPRGAWIPLLSSSCCRFLHPTEPSGTQAQAGCSHSAARPQMPRGYPHLPAPRPSIFNPASEQLIFTPFPGRQGNCQGLSTCWKCREGEMGLSSLVPCCKLATVTCGGMNSPLPSTSDVAKAEQQHTRVS